MLEKLSDEQLCWHVQKNFFHNRNAAVAAFQSADNSLSLSSIQELLSWKDLTSVNVSDGTTGGTSVHGRSLDGTMEVGSETTSDLASSPEIQQLIATMQLLQEKLRVLEEEKALAPDEDEDRSAGGRRLPLLPAVLNLLPLDPVREELTKTTLASILRMYPLPSGYTLKAGELSVDEKARLPALVAEEISKLGKIINRYTDVARPLLGLLNVLQHDTEAGNHLVSIPMVRDVTVHALQLLFHHNSKLETERHLVHFKDEKVLHQLSEVRQETVLLRVGEDQDRGGRGRAQTPPENQGELARRQEDDQEEAAAAYAAARRTRPSGVNFGTGRLRQGQEPALQARRRQRPRQRR